MAGGLVVEIALDDATLEPDPTWTDLTATDNLVGAAQIDRGRSYELDRTDTSTATVQINDVDGVLDPTNTTGPYFNKIEPLLQVRLSLLNPVTDEVTCVYRGYIEDFDYVFDPSQRVNQLTMSLVDAFAILTAIEMQADGTFGDSPPPSVVGNIFFDNATVGPVTDGPGGRVEQVLGNAGWPVDLQDIFSGNVSLQESIYAPGDTVLQVIQDAADAEFPGLANVYVDKFGIVTFHGRKAKFDPIGVSDGTSWNFQQWKAGDGAAVAASLSDTAQIRALSMNRGLSKVINQAYATPQGISPSDVASQVKSDPTSIGIYGIRSWSAENLLTAGGLNDGLNANDECALFATYYIANYAGPRNRITAIAFKSLRPEDPRAAANWLFLCGVEISDLLALTVSSPGGGGFNLEPWFIEGIHYDIKPLNGQYADVTLTLDLSPQAYFADGSMFEGDT